MWDSWEELAQFVVTGICIMFAIPLLITAIVLTVTVLDFASVKIRMYEAQKEVEVAKIEAQMPAKKGCER
jgi:hypothetical protein